AGRRSAKPSGRTSAIAQLQSSLTTTYRPGTAAGPATGLASIVTNAWVKHAVHNICQKVRNHREDRHEQGDAHDDSVVALIDRVEDQPTQSVPGEDLLDDHRAAEEGREIQRQQRD